MSIFYVTSIGTKTTGASTADDFSNANCYPTPAAAITAGAAISGPHTLIIFSGTYDSYIALSHANWANSSVIGKNVLTGSVAKKGEVIVSSSTTHGLSVTVAGVTTDGVSITCTGAANDGLYFTAAGLNVDSLYVLSSGRYAVFATSAATGAKIKRLWTFFQSSTSATFRLDGTSSGSIEYSVIENNIAAPHIQGLFQIGSSGVWNIYNNTIPSHCGNLLLCTNAASVVNFKNNIVGPTHSISTSLFRTSGTINADYNCIISNWYYASQIIHPTGTVNFGDHNILSKPMIKAHQRSGIIVPCVDDAANHAYALGLSTLFKSLSVKGTFFVDARSAVINKSSVQAVLDAGGLTLGCHSYSHSDISVTGNVWTLARSGNTVTFSNATGALSYNGGAAAGAWASDLRALTLAEIKTGLQADGWTVTDALYSTASSLGKVQSTSLGESLASVTAGTALALLIDATAQTGYFKVEIGMAKALLESNFGVTLKSFATPYGASSAASQAAVLACGFIGSRDLYNTNYYLSNIDLAKMHGVDQGSKFGPGEINQATSWASGTAYDLSSFILVSGSYYRCIKAGTSGASAPTFKTSVNTTTQDNTVLWVCTGTETQHILHRTVNYAEMVAQHGVCIFMLSHTIAGLTAAQWSIVLKEFAKYKQILVSDMDTVLDSILLTHSSVDGRNYTRTFQDSSDNRILDTSRCCNTGLVVTGTNDDEQIDAWGGVTSAYPNIGAAQGAGAGYGPWATCAAPLPLSAQITKSHALPIGVGKITIFEGVASQAQIEEAK